MDLDADSEAGDCPGLCADHRLADVGSGTSLRGRPEPREPVGDSSGPPQRGGGSRWTLGGLVLGLARLLRRGCRQIRQTSRAFVRHAAGPAWAASVMVAELAIAVPFGTALPAFQRILRFGRRTETSPCARLPRRRGRQTGHGAGGLEAACATATTRRIYQRPG